MSGRGTERPGGIMAVAPISKHLLRSGGGEFAAPFPRRRMGVNIRNGNCAVPPRSKVTTPHPVPLPLGEGRRCCALRGAIQASLLPGGEGQGEGRFPQFDTPSGRKTISLKIDVTSDVARAYPLNQPISMQPWKGGQGWRFSSCPQVQAARSRAEPSARRLARFGRMAACAGGARPAPRLP